MSRTARSGALYTRVGGKFIEPEHMIYKYIRIISIKYSDISYISRVKLLQ